MAPAPAYTELRAGDRRAEMFDGFVRDLETISARVATATDRR
jgi:hypothetical protein